jgi:hypothetical protein
MKFITNPEHLSGAFINNPLTFHVTDWQALRLAKGRGDGDGRAERLMRKITPMLKFRACRDNVTVATATMEVMVITRIGSTPNSSAIAHLGAPPLSSGHQSPHAAT